MLTKEHVRRRIEEGIDAFRRASLTDGQLSVALAERPAEGLGSDSPDARRQRSRMLRLKASLVEEVLPRVNLTSYRNLRRAYERLGRVARERDEALTAASEAAGERDRLAVQLKVAVAQRSQTGRELANVRQAHHAVLADRERLSAELASSSEEGVRLSQELAASAEERGRLSAELASAADERERLKAQVASALSDQTQLSTQQGHLTAERARLSAAVQLLETRLRQVLSERERLSRELAMLVTERDHLCQKLQDDRAGHLEGDPPVLADLESSLVPISASLEHVRAHVEDLVRAAPFGLGSQFSAGFERMTALRSLLMARSLLPEVRHLLETFYGGEDDPNLAELWSVYDEAEARDLPYWDIRAAARAAARILEPRTYLEVGTRRGWSLAQVLAERPQAHAYIFEVWAPDYGSAEQGSPSYIRDKMQEIVGPRYSPQLTFIDGDSHELLPRFVAGELGAAPREFDLITVDGDHSRLGAWWDLTDLLPHVKVGGALLFDDLEYAGDEELGSQPKSNHPRPAMPAYAASLMDVWGAIQMLHPNFIYLASPTLRYRTGIAVRYA